VGADSSAIPRQRASQWPSPLKRLPQKAYAFLVETGVPIEHRPLRYPGVRSDSDTFTFTFGYAFRPWNELKVLAGG
jgi:cation diffusion facilitator CzcD-associated flavoprotein CzcO